MLLSRVKFSNSLSRNEIMWFSNLGHYEVVKFLIEKGAEINAKNKDNQTPLMYAVMESKNYRKSTQIIIIMFSHLNTFYN